jgi:hypothetical protein
MAFENASHIDELDESSPLLTDDPFGTNAMYLELQQLKTVLKTDFPNVDAAVTTTPAELNILDGATVTTAELNILDGVTATAAELNILDGVTSTAAELNILDGVTSTAAELNILDGVTSTAAELNILDGATVTTAELNKLDGVAGDAVGTTDTQTLTNKTLTSPDINGGTVDNAPVGATTPNTGVFTTLGATTSLGYDTGAGGTVTQATSRTTGVTLNKASGAITLVSAAGSTSWQTFTVTNSVVAATDTLVVNQKSGADLYQIHVTNVAAGSFDITFATTAGTTTEQPTFNFAVIKGVTS